MKGDRRFLSKGNPLVTMNDIIERFAIRAAKGNNGGEWSSHYTEDQREKWRQFVRDLIADLEDEICDALGIPDEKRESILTDDKVTDSGLSTRNKLS